MTQRHETSVKSDVADKLKGHPGPKDAHQGRGGTPPSPESDSTSKTTKHSKGSKGSGASTKKPPFGKGGPDSDGDNDGD